MRPLPRLKQEHHLLQIRSTPPSSTSVREADLGWLWLRCRWRRVSPPPPPRGARCWLSPCCWPTCSASSCPRSWVWRPAAAGPLHLAAERWARPEASESRRSCLEEEEGEQGESQTTVILTCLHLVLKHLRKNQHDIQILMVPAGWTIIIVYTPLIVGGAEVLNRMKVVSMLAFNSKHCAASTWHTEPGHKDKLSVNKIKREEEQRQRDDEV